MKKVVVLFSFLLIVTTVCANDIVITEIMANPSGTDGNREWIEIYNNDIVSVDMTGWKFFEAGSNHGLSLSQGSLTLAPGDFAVIVDDPSDFLTDYPGFTGNIFDSTWTSLTNTGENISIKDSSLDFIDTVFEGEETPEEIGYVAT